MNIFVPQTIQTQVELEEIAAADLQFIHPAVSKSSIGIVQDGLIGAYNLTNPSLGIDWRTSMNLLSYTTLTDFTKVKKESMKGPDLYSLILPTAINLTTKDLKIKNGKIIEGRVVGNNLGFKEQNTIIQLIWDEYGKVETENFIDDTQKLTNNFNLWHGFSVGYGDIIRTPDVISQIDKLFETKKTEIKYLVTETENNPELMKKDALEQSMYNKLKNINQEVEKLIMNNLSDTNGFYVMAKSGSKGKPEHASQIMGCMGQHAFEGKLIPKRYNGRTSPYFHIDDDSAESRGLTRRCFTDGLEWTDFIYQMLHGRSGLIDQAVRTAETGYMQRKLIKSLEDVMVKYDGTVRNANDTIVQFVYGDSGADCISQFEYSIRLMDTNNEQLEKEHLFTDQELVNMDFPENTEFYETVKNIRDQIRTCIQKAKMAYMFQSIKFMIPVNLTRIIENIKETYNNKGEQLKPSYVFKKLNDLMTNTETPLVPMSQKERENENSFKNKDENIHKTILRAAIYDALSPKKVIIEYRMDKEHFDEVINYISKSFEKNIIEPGEMIGIIAATSTGEPLTQMNLSSFHQSGVARMTSSISGVPRMKEVFSVSKNLKGPQMTIYLSDDVRAKKDIAYKISSSLKHITFGEIRERINVYYDPRPKLGEGLSGKDNIIPVAFSHKDNKLSCQTDISGLPWLLRVELNREKIAEKEITLLDIISNFCNWWSTRYLDSKNMKKEERKVMSKITQMAVLSNSDSDKEPIVHIRFNAKDGDKDNKFDLNTVNDFIIFIIDKLKLKGLNNVEDITAIPEENTIVFDKNTGDVRTEKEYVILTKGVNLTDIRYLYGIDLNRTISNDIVQVYNTFGIEIARSVLMKEVFDAYSNAGANVNTQHIQLTVDLMTMTGTVNSIDRHGLNKSDADPLSRASFEKPVEQLWNAAIFGESDNMKGVSSRIMCGQCIKGGTGYHDLILNTEMIQNSGYSESVFDTKYTEVKTENLTTDILNRESGDMFMPM